MIISETQIRVPSKKYTLMIRCTKTRRLTAIEWLILTCISKFKNSEVMSKKTLKMAFEQVLDLQDSNYLIKPSINSLSNLGVIETEGFFDYNKTRFSSINLTEKGIKMLHDGLLPGKSSDFKCTIWYNPLTKQLNSQEIRKGVSNETIVFGTKDLFDNTFPKQIIIEKLQSGEIESGRFIASEYIIDDIEDIITEDSDTLLTLISDIDHNGKLTITPEIHEEKMRDRIGELFVVKALKQYGLKNLIPKKMIEVNQVLGSGTKIKEALRDVSRNGKFIIVDKWVFDAFLNEKEFFYNNFIFIFNSETLSAKVLDSTFIISVPFSFDVPGCVIINDKNQSVSLCKSTSSYYEKNIEYPLAVTDQRIGRKNDTVLQWFEKEIQKNAKRDIAYLGLFLLPILKASNTACNNLKVLWENKSFDSIIIDINRVLSVPKELGFVDFDFSSLYPLLGKKIDSSNFDQLISNIQKLVDSGVLIKGSTFHKEIIKIALSKLQKKPVLYSELKKLQTRLGVDNHEIALLFDDLFDPLYDVNIVRDYLNQIMTGNYETSDELFSGDEFFNTYYENIEKIQFLIGGINIFKNQDETAFRKKVTNCPNVALLQANIAELKEKNATLAENCNINIYSLFNEIDSSKANIFYNNLSSIDKFLLEKINGVISTEKKYEPEEPKHINEQIYVIDTCSLIKHEELLQYFKNSEYIRIPLKVLEELGNIKDKRVYKNHRISSFNNDTLFDRARFIAKDIRNSFMNLFNSINNLTLRFSKSDTSVLPEELDSSIPDNMILSVALKYKDWNVVLITDDNQFGLTAESLGIKTLTGEDFMKTHNSNYLPKADLKDKYLSAKKASEEVVIWCKNHGEY